MKVLDNHTHIVSRAGTRILNYRKIISQQAYRLKVVCQVKVTTNIVNFNYNLIFTQSTLNIKVLFGPI